MCYIFIGTKLVMTKTRMMMPKIWRQLYEADLPPYLDILFQEFLYLLWHMTQSYSPQNVWF